MKNKLILLLCLVGIMGLFIWKSNQTQPTTHVIQLRDNGFYPKDIQIKKGDIVVFTPMISRPFWPASNFHPLHLIYPEFDAKKPLKESWKFTFTIAGQWRYHDHLNPSYTGTIRVADTSGNDSIDTALCNMDGTTKPGKKRYQSQCWQQTIEKVLHEKGLEEAFNTFTNLYDTQKEFRPICHDITHVLGEAAFRDFIAHKQFTITTKSSYCGYGFYHGFNEALVQTNTDYGKAREFCDSINKTFEKGVNPSAAIAACYHGIGHGVFDLQDVKYWGDEKIMVENSLKVCDSVTSHKDAHMRDLCVTGIFNSLANAYGANNYELEYKKDDPLWICTIQKDIDKKNCYPEITNAYLIINNFSIEKAFQYIETIPDTSSAQQTVYAYIAEYVKSHFNMEDKGSLLSYCHSTQERLRLWCVRGIALVLLQWNKPGYEYEAIEFCKSEKRLLPDEQDACYAVMVPLLPTMYNKTTVKKICDSLPQEYKNYCPGQK